MSEWSSKIRELESTGMTLVDIGRAIGLSTSSVSDIKRGASKEPRGMAAVRLFDLHKKIGEGEQPKAA